MTRCSSLRSSARWSARRSTPTARGDPLRRRPEPVHRAAMWRAARSGLAGPLLDRRRIPVPRAAADVVRTLLDRLRGRLEDVRRLGRRRRTAAAALLARGDSSSRQRNRYAERGQIDRRRGARRRPRPAGADPFPTSPPESDRRLPRVARRRGARARPASRTRPTVRCSRCSTSLGLPEMAGADARPRASMRSTTGSPSAWTGSSSRSRSISCRGSSPRTSGRCWRRAHPTGPRARAVPARRLRPGEDRRGRRARLADDRTTGRSGWTAARQLPADVMRAPVIGFDLVRDSLGGLARARGQHARAVRRRLRDRHAAADATGAARADRRRVDPRSGARRSDCSGARCAAVRCASDPVVALLSDGADNSAWYEHQMIAREARPAARAAERDRRRRRTSCAPAGAAWTCSTCAWASSWLDLRNARGEPIGEQILAAAQRRCCRAGQRAGRRRRRRQGDVLPRPRLHQLLPGRAAAAAAGAHLPLRRRRTSAASCSAGSTSWSPSRSTGTAAAGC